MPGEKKKKKNQEDQKERAQRKKQQKRRRRQEKQRQQREQVERQRQAEVDSLVSPIYSTGLADAYKYFLHELYKEGVRFNVYEFAAQKILKYQKMQKQKAKKIQQLHMG